MLWLISDDCPGHGSGGKVNKCYVFVIPDQDLMKNKVHAKTLLVEQLSSVYSVLGTVLRAVYMLTHLILKATHKVVTKEETYT